MDAIVNKTKWFGIDTEFDAMGQASKFKIDMQNASTGEKLTILNNFKEIMWSYQPLELVVQGNYLKGAKSIDVVDKLDLQIGDRLAYNYLKTYSRVDEEGYVIEEIIEMNQDYTYNSNLVLTDGGSFTVESGANVTLYDDETEIVTVVENRVQALYGGFIYVEDIKNNTIYIKNNLGFSINDSETLKRVGHTGLYRTNVEFNNTGEYFVSFSHPVMGHTSQKVTVTNTDIDVVYSHLDTGFKLLIDKKAMRVIA